MEEEKMKEINFKHEKIILLLVSLIICSCSLNGRNNLLLEGIKNKYKECSTENSCLIDLGSELGFEWDSMYVFGVNTTPSFITSSTGIEYSKSKDLTRVILFIKNDQIVHKIRDKLNPERPFRLHFVGNEQLLSRDSAVFLIEKTAYDVFDVTLKILT